MKKINFLTLIFILIINSAALSKEVDESVVKNLTMDKKAKIISYELTKPAVVRIRAGSKSGPLHRNLVNWQIQQKGKQVIKWDGLDSSGTFNILDNNNFTFSFNYYLPGKDEPMFNFAPLEDNIIVISDNFIGRAPKFIHLSQMHKNHKKQHCKDIEVIFELPADIQKDKQKVYIIKEATPITIKLSKKDKPWFTQERFSINIFIDDVFIKGEALGYTSYTWNFNPKGINKGKHLITVNIKGFNDHIGIGSLPIIIE